VTQGRGPEGAARTAAVTAPASRESAFWVAGDVVPDRLWHGLTPKRTCAIGSMMPRLRSRQVSRGYSTSQPRPKASPSRTG